jgi:Asp-tRNA(Asn)/Glu-tRNA(Gln) amidotransferase A subunit family amidase
MEAIVPDNEICWMTAAALAAAQRDGRVTAVEAVEAVLDRIAHADPAINAFITVTREAALEEAHAADRRRDRSETLGPLHGVPVSIKDILYTKGVRTTAGSKVFENFIPVEDAIVVKRLKAAGAIVIGKTSTPEFCHKTVTDAPLFGTTRNPWDLTRTTAGSSGGSAAAVAAGLGPLSIGTDGGGSIRLPAALCGVVGLKPSAGCVPQYPGFAGWEFLGHTGPLARTVEDIALAMRVIAGPDARDPSSLMSPATPDAPSIDKIRVAVARSLNHLEAEPDIEAGLDQVVAAAKALGNVPQEASPSWTDPDLLFRVIVASELAGALTEHVAADGARMDPTLVKMVEYGASLRATDLVRALEWRRALARTMFAWFENYDLLIVPASPVVAFSADIIGPKVIAGRKTSPYDWFAWTWPFNISGQPAISLPVWSNGHLPVGVQIVGRPGADELVLAFAAMLERQLGYPALSRRPNFVTTDLARGRRRPLRNQ